MKLLIGSDIHGDVAGAKGLLRAFESEGCDRILLLGDLLYHGPRNDLPAAYAPKEVISLLCAHREHILCVRGNCEAEVDQMVLNFPCLADYCLLALDGLNIFATHGHHYNLQTPPPLHRGDILLHGHTHIPDHVPFAADNLYLNPGSPSLPKEGNPKTYLVYEARTFTLKTLSGNTVWKTVL